MDMEAVACIHASVVYIYFGFVLFFFKKRQLEDNFFKKKGIQGGSENKTPIP